MRAGACAVQQTLSPEAASVLKHSLVHAHRRGHAQLTPLHVAATLLASSSRFSATLRRASLKSSSSSSSHHHHHHHHHHLQCRALQLCFNVALNRLPATSPGGGGPLLLHAPPSLSNALIAALKRAQAHQRRTNCTEQQQQQQNFLVAIRVDLDQLILSILDDPSVSRVMREAGFSSTLVKNNLEDSRKNLVPSAFLCYNNYNTLSNEVTNPSSNFWQNPNFLFSPQNKNLSSCMSGSSSLKDDIKAVFDVLLGKTKKNIVLVGDSLSTAEGLAEEVMSKFEKGDDVPEELKSVRLIKLQFSAVPLRFMKKQEVDMNVGDLKRKVESFGLNGTRVIIYIGDLKWAVERDIGDERELEFTVDYLIAEIGKLVSWYNNMSSNTMRVWLMATANYETYMKCKMKQPCLDVQWDLEAISVPSRGLGLSLNASSGWDSRFTSKSYLCPKEEQDNVLTCCPECISNFEKENDSVQLPYWLKPHGNKTLDKEDLVQLTRKYNKLCQNPHSSSPVTTNPCYLGKNYYQSSSYPCWSNKNDVVVDSETISFAYPSLKPNQTPSSLPLFRRQPQSCHVESGSKYGSMDPNLDSLKSMEGKEVKLTLSLGNLLPDDEKIAVDVRDLIQENVPWQCETIPLILGELMDCSKAINEDKLLLIQGNDVVGKRRLAVGIAKSMFGSPDMLFCMNMRSNANYTVSENRGMLEMALRNHEKIVVLVEDVDYADPEFVRFLVDGFEDGKVGTYKKDYSCRAIVILTTDGDTSCNVTRDSINSVIQMKLLLVKESKHGLRMSSFDRKRKSDWISPIRIRNQRKYNEMEEVSSNVKRILSSNALDLNIKADDDDDQQGNLSPISSDLTREITIEHPNSLTLLKKIKNQFVFNKSSDKDERAREMLLSKFKRSFHEATNYASCFEVEENVLEEVLEGSSFYLNGLFEKWLKDIFRTSLRMVEVGDHREKVSVRLCLDGKLFGESCGKDGFMGTCLPKRIPVCFTS